MIDRCSAPPSEQHFRSADEPGKFRDGGASAPWLVTTMMGFLTLLMLGLTARCLHWGGTMGALAAGVFALSFLVVLALTARCLKVLGEPGQ